MFSTSPPPGLLRFEQQIFRFKLRHWKHVFSNFQNNLTGVQLWQNQLIRHSLEKAHTCVWSCSSSQSSKCKKQSKDQHKGYETTSKPRTESRTKMEFVKCACETVHLENDNDLKHTEGFSTSLRWQITDASYPVRHRKESQHFNKRAIWLFDSQTKHLLKKHAFSLSLFIVLRRYPCFSSLSSQPVSPPESSWNPTGTWKGKTQNHQELCLIITIM